jgi:glycyl-tRNA synthetase beta chain
MPDLLLEFFSEEIPARMQPRAVEDLRKLVTDRPGRIGSRLRGRQSRSPRLGGWPLSVHGSAGASARHQGREEGPARRRARECDCRIPEGRRVSNRSRKPNVQPDKKGDFYVAVIDRPGRPAIEVIAEVIPEVARTFPWPKSMRWGTDDSIGCGRFHSVVATFGPETEEPEIVRFEIDGIASGDETRGHRFMAPAPFKVRRFEDYVAKLEQAKVVLDRRAAPTRYLQTPRTSPLRRASNWSRTRACCRSHRPRRMAGDPDGHF